MVLIIYFYKELLGLGMSFISLFFDGFLYRLFRTFNFVLLDTEVNRSTTRYPTPNLKR